MPVPVVVIGGFLGAGKTTLLNFILSENHGVRAGVLVNDFGAINIDAGLVVGVDGEAIDLANGCVCCSIRDDLIAACLELLQRPEPPELLIIETSGVSDPVQVANTFLMPELRTVMALDGILAVVDAEQFPDLLAGETSVLARTQVQAADIVVLNKVDLVDAGRLDVVTDLLREIAPGSRTLRTIHGRASLELLLGACADQAEVQRPDVARGGVFAEHGFSTWHWSCDQPLSLPRLRAVIAGLPETIYRAKGIVYLEELPAYRVAMQVVGKRSAIGDTGRWGSDRRRTQIVVIASSGGIDSEALQCAFDGCVGAGDESRSPILALTRRLAGGRVDYTDDEQQEGRW